MALRVLLADESTTIKKVMQLALQDFAVEVKAVHAGVDVLDVARSFQPDVIFADVLLQKKNGYEVSALLKADGELRSVPVVLMWSSFMDLDDGLAKKSGADGRLEKPFDVETLRKIILELVPKTRTQRLAHFLDFPQRPSEDLREEESRRKVEATPPPLPERPAATAQPAVAPAPAPAPAPAATASAAIHLPPPVPPTPPKPQTPETPSWSMESFDDPEAFADSAEDDEVFKPLELSNLGHDSVPELLETESSDAPLGLATSSDDESWTHQDLSRFKLDLPPVTVESDDGPDNNIRIDMGEEQFTAPAYRPPEVEQTEPVYSPTPTYASNPNLATQPPSSFGDLQSDFRNDHGIDFGDAEEIALPEQTFGLDDESLSLESSTLDTGKIPPSLSADRLEEIIRAQSRDIIEAVVRRIVPDLATAIIREELERLLEDTAVLESQSLEKSPGKRKGPNL